MKIQLLILVALLLTGFASTTNAQQFAGTSASNSNVESTDVLRSFKDEKQYLTGNELILFPRFIRHTIHGYTKSRWGVGVLADGDFSKALTDNTVAPRTGNLGITAVKTATIFPLKRNESFTSSQEVREYFGRTLEQVRSYDKLRGSASEKAFDDTIRQWKRDTTLMKRRRISYTERLQKAVRDSSMLSRADVSSFPEYKTAIGAKRESTEATAKKAYDDFIAFQPDFTSMAEPIKNQFPKDSILELNFVKTSELIQLQKKLDEETIKRDALLQQIQSLKANDPSYRTLHQRLYTHENNVDIYEKKIAVSDKARAIWGDKYLDSLARYWPRIRDKQKLLIANLSQAQRANNFRLPQPQYDAIVANSRTAVQLNLDSLRTGQQRNEKRLSFYNERVKQADLPFDKPRYWNQLEFNALISLGNEIDSLRANYTTTGTPRTVTNQTFFGSNLLVPGSAVRAGRAVTLNLIWFPWIPERPRLFTIGFHGYLNYASTRWSAQQGPDSARTVTTQQVGILSLSAGFHYNILQVDARTTNDGHREGNDVKLAMQLDVIYRNIGGELGREANSPLRENFLGTSTRNFYGWQPSLIASIDNFRLTFSYSYFGKDVPGFSRGYPVVGFGFSGNLQAGQSAYSGAKPWKRMSRRHNRNAASY
jgi:hypothetical protein